MENNEKSAVAWDEDDVILPEGGLDESDLTTGDEDPTEDVPEGASSQAEDNKAQGEAPTPEQKTERDADGKVKEDAPTTEQTTETKPNKLKFKAKIDRKDVDAEIDFDELPGLYQKAQNFDRVKGKLDKQTALVQDINVLCSELGFKSPEDLIAHARNNHREGKIKELIDGGTAQEVAEYIVDSKIEKARNSASQNDLSLEEEQTETHSEKTESKSDDLDFKAQVDELFVARPDLVGKLQRLPDEVSEAVITQKIPLRVAYAEWESKQIKAERDKAIKERDLLVQQAEAAARSPVRGVSGNNPTKSEAEDPWIKGFTSEGW